MSEHKFPTEVIDIPSGGKIYPKDSPLADGKIEIKYMTTKEEDILMSENLIKKGVVIDKLLDSLIVTKGVTQESLVLGDKNAVLVAARILAYGPDYTCEVTNPNNPEQKVEHTFDLTECPFKTISDDVDYSNNSFDYEMPVSKVKVKFKLLTGVDEKQIEKEIEQSSKYGYNSEITTRLRYTITEVDGDNTPEKIIAFSQNMLARDSMALRRYINDISPDIDLTSEIKIEFFWPKSI
jgi:hypothetical protein